MSPVVDPDAERYAEDHTTPEPDHLVVAAERTHASTEAPQMMVGRVEGRFLQMLVHLAQARRVLEIGTFTGYSAMAMAEALPDGGHIVTCDIDPKAVELARGHVEASPYADRIEFRLGPALDTINTLQGPFDLVFIDADKVNYEKYYEACLPLLSERGLIAVDNVLWNGKVLEPDRAEPDDADTRAIAAFNDHVRDDPRVVSVMLTVRDGVTLVRRR